MREQAVALFEKNAFRERTGAAKAPSSLLRRRSFVGKRSLLRRHSTTTFLSRRLDAVDVSLRPCLIVCFARK